MRVRFEREMDADRFAAALFRHARMRVIPVVDVADLDRPRPCYYVTTPDDWMGRFCDLLHAGFDWPWLRWWDVFDRVCDYKGVSSLKTCADRVGFPGLIRFAWDVVAMDLGLDLVAIDSADRLGGLPLVSEMISTAAKERTNEQSRRK